ncbi:MAG: hypothetical protein D6746_10870 [Bacteroidetes bacterium]|nr:MAG: hypothetical protein D6746_10870 [Bacteroidota bacterium]
MTHLVRVVAAARQIDVSKGEARYLAAVVLFGARKAYEGAGISRSHGTVLATRLRRKGVEVRDEEKIKKLWDLRKLSIIWRLPGDR